MPDSRNILKTFNNEYVGSECQVTLHCPEFTSLCPYTGNPDFGVLDIIYTPSKKCIESKSLKLYILSYRSVRIFNEHAVNRILEDIIAVCKPRQAKVIGCFNIRGGISIRVEATYTEKRSRVK